MKIVSSKTMQSLDRQTIENGVPSELLMERAGRGVFEEILRFTEKLNSRHVKHFVILAGKGNNGGDGYVIARYFAEQTSYQVSVFSVCKPTALKSDAKLNAERLPKNIDIVVGDEIPQNWFDVGVIFIDCLLGTGITGIVKEPYASIISKVNNSGLPIIAVDIPSGLNGDDGTIENAGIRADLTVTIGLPKTGLFCREGLENCGLLRLVDIGIPKSFIDRAQTSGEAIFHQDTAPCFKRLPPHSHKGTMGRILVIGGSIRFPGAAMLTGSGTLRAGGGLVSVAYPKSIGSLIKPKDNALILIAMEDNGLGFHKAPGKSELDCLIKDKDVIAVGPGLTREKESVNVVKELLSTEKTLVLDADALHVFSVHQSVFPRSGITVLTPHPGEMKRILLALKLDSILKENRLTQAMTVATKLHAHIVLKGAATVVAGPGGEVSINTSGSPALATGGTGDVLTGIIAAMLCQFEDPLTALKCAVFIHGLAGELAPRGMRNLIADDLLPLIGEAMKDVSPFA